MAINVYLKITISCTAMYQYMQIKPIQISQTLIT